MDIGGRTAVPPFDDRRMVSVSCRVGGHVCSGLANDEWCLSNRPGGRLLADSGSSAARGRADG